MPRIACRLDKLNWQIISKIIKYIFQDTNIKITVTNYMPYVGNISLIEPINIHLLHTRDEYLENIIEATKNSELSDIIWIRKVKS